MRIYRLIEMVPIAEKLLARRQSALVHEALAAITAPKRMITTY